MRRISMFAVLMMAASSLAAQSEPIDADRPGVAEGPGVVEVGTLQIELGVQSERSDDGGVSERERFMPTLVRYGLMDQLELRLETDGFASSKIDFGDGSDSENGLAPIALGAKFQFFDHGDDQWLGSAGLLGSVTVPSGSGEFKQDDVTADLRFSAELHPMERWSINPNVGLATYHDARGDSKVTPTIAVEAEYEVADVWKPFVELALDAPEEGDDDAPFLADAGVAWVVRNDTQVDFAIGSGLSGDAPDFFWTVGVSHRFAR